MDQWIELTTEGRIIVHTGKVDIGQRLDKIGVFESLYELHFLGDGIANSEYVLVPPIVDHRLLVDQYCLLMRIGNDLDADGKTWT